MCVLGEELRERGKDLCTSPMSPGLASLTITTQVSPVRPVSTLPSLEEITATAPTTSKVLLSYPGDRVPSGRRRHIFSPTTVENTPVVGTFAKVPSGVTNRCISEPTITPSAIRKSLSG
jgi:hypothetical protein